MKEYTVELGDRSYPIFIGNCLQSEQLQKVIPNREIVIVTNETIAPIYLEQVGEQLSASDRRIGSVVLPDGESYKTLDTVNRIFSYLLKENYSRKVALVALGGGVIGDMTGFAAASYQRGVDFYQVPTTLLSQVDSSVGGKTGVNHPLGKNMIGAFKQPKAVFIDPNTLKTLPQRELAAGFAEVIKHGIIQSPAYFDQLERDYQAILSLDPEVLARVIETSCQIKSSVVAKDETEQGVRAILNFGHTFGHAIETTQGYGVWLHGEAVATGMLMAADLSCRLGLLSASDLDRIKKLLVASGLPTEAPVGMTPQEFRSAMMRDKKVDTGTLRLVLVRAVGDAFVSSEFSDDALEAMLAEFCQS